MDAPARPRLPADDDELWDLDLRGLRTRWAEAAARPPMTAEAMTGADRRAQALGVPGERLMEHAGTAVAAAVRAIAADQDRAADAPILVLCGLGNNGGGGVVAGGEPGRARFRGGGGVGGAGPRPRAPG